MKQLNLYEAKTKLSQLVDAAARGEPVIIAKAGRPLAKLVPYEAPRQITFGTMPDIEIADDFDAPLPDDILDAFEGRDA
ncbi:type II toxin-antitoxin system prevent-host-death family antitoxin [Salinarimonas sp.]|uniref:type II toxin-antitoxin system Phd/YefM family antitoxin n=1 Tax=Salinarimonas sp. TaxID=2766526 RepID=UPI0032D95C89